MKADIDAKGTLILTPETPMESFALKCWWEKVPAGSGSVISPYIIIRPPGEGERRI